MTSFFSRWNSDSLISDERLMHAREGYRPTRRTPTAELDFARWTARVSVQPALVVARELSGLPNENLDALAAHFEKAPRHRRRDLARFALPLGGILLVTGLMLMALDYLAYGTNLTSMFALGCVLAAVGVVGIGIGIATSFSLVSVDMAYGKVGLYVGELNEQHPWLYKTSQLMDNSAAEDYRQRVLRERGALRGVDYLMMHEIASAQEKMDLTQTARTIRERVQTLPTVPMLRRPFDPRSSYLESTDAEGPLAITHPGPESSRHYLENSGESAGGDSRHAG